VNSEDLRRGLTTAEVESCGSRLKVPGSRRLEMAFGEPIDQILV
jgi:hypothetical protein